MPHLVAEKVGGSVLLGEAGAVGVAEVVVLEVYAEGFFGLFGVIFHRIDGLYFAVRQGVDEFERGEGRAIRIGDNGLVPITYLAVVFNVYVTVFKVDVAPLETVAFVDSLQ